MEKNIIKIGEKFKFLGHTLSIIKIHDKDLIKYITLKCCKECCSKDLKIKLRITEMDLEEMITEGILKKSNNKCEW